MAKQKAYVTITGLKYYFGNSVFKIGAKCRLLKDTENDYDDEAIKVVLGANLLVGYIANSSYTVVRGTLSAGRLYDKFDDQLEATVMFIDDKSVIAKVKLPKKWRQ